MAMVVLEEDINNELLIEEVQMRPALYDKKIKEYFDSNVRNKMWEEVTENVFRHIWDNLSKQQQTDAEKLLMKRWQNFRTCFTREVNNQKLSESGLAPKKWRKYLYYDKLLFLLPYIRKHNTKGLDTSIEENNGDSDKEEISQTSTLFSPHSKMQSLQLESHTTPYTVSSVPHTTPHNSSSTHRKKCIEEKLLEILQKKKNEKQCENQETNFMLSLVPMLEAVPEVQKLDVQIQILEILRKMQLTKTELNQTNTQSLTSSIIKDVDNISSCSSNYIPTSDVENKVDIKKNNYNLNEDSNKIRTPLLNRAREEFLEYDTDNSNRISKDIINKRDEYEIYGENVASRLRHSNQGFYSIALAKNKIDNILFLLEIGKLESSTEIKIET